MFIFIQLTRYGLCENLHSMEVFYLPHLQIIIIIIIIIIISSVGQEKRSNRTKCPWAISLTSETVPLYKIFFLKFAQSYDNTITLIKRKKTWSTFWELNGPNLWKTLLKDTLCQVWLKLAHWSPIRRFSNIVNVIRVSTLGKVRGPSFEQTWIPSPFFRDTYCLVGWNWLTGSGEKDFKNFVNVFSLFY